MRTWVLVTIVAVAAGEAVSWSPAVAQQPDSTTRRRRPVVITLPAVLSVDTPTLVVVAPAEAADTLGVWTTGSAVARAAGLKPASLTPRGQLADRRHAALSVLPPDLVVGYVLAAPGIRPTLVRGAIARAALEDSARAFLRLYRGPRR